MVSTNRAAKSAAAAATAAEQAIAELEGASQLAAPPTATGNRGSNGNGRALRFEDAQTQRAYYQQLDQKLAALIEELASEYGQPEPTVYDDLSDRIVERLFVIRCKLIKAVVAGKARTGEQMSDGFRSAFRQVMAHLCAALFPGADPDVLIRMRGLPTINPTRFSRNDLQRLANRAAEEYGGTEVASEGYDLLDEAREARQQ